MNVRIVKLAAMIALTALVGCGDGDNNHNNVKVYPKNDTGPTADVGHDVDEVDDTSVPSDAGDDTGEPLEDVGPDATEPDVTPVACEDGCGPGEDCINDTCRIVDSCAAAIDLGTLVAGVPQTISGSLNFEGADDLQATCNPMAGKDRVVTFELSETSVFRHQATWTGQFDGVIELRRSCADGADVVQCNDNEDRTMVLEAGRYYLVMDQVFGNAGNYELTVSAETALCVPGVTSCNGNMLEMCPNALNPVSVECAASCSNGTCQGSMCSNAIPVSGSGTFSGDGAAFSTDLNFGSNLGCTDAGDAGVPIATPGFEVIFYLGPLSVGQVIHVDAQTDDPNINAIFITRTCGDTDACAASFKLSEIVEWEVDSPGEYYVIVDKRFAGNSRFNYTVSVQ